MKTHVTEAFSKRNVEHVKFHEPLARYTTWRIGGLADVLVAPASVQELRGALQAASDLGLPWTVIGKGSNVLVQDGGVRGLVLHMGGAFADISVQGTKVIAQAGRSFVSAANISLRNDLQGLEFATGIPGSVGGAVMMNAGAHGGEVREVLEWADAMDSEGRVHHFTNADLQFDYRYSILKDNPMVVVTACFNLEPGNGQPLLQEVKRWSVRRAATQPLSQPNCGSVFRNPPGNYSARLIETAGLKGLRRGDAQISEKHANFIVNLGHATARDVLWLMNHVQETVANQFNIHLETEVRIIGEPASGR
ncbi:UDP-N-acetylmuramate dehydrogenase [Alicyclobacillus sp. SO9]|uniref:UDP-N-acetylmuramate dehydrogenase n=1 Tax=Alicyclobacillus sp. SO9 TaxID=2665646 RepID=UPI0018E77017|nr:UDP-N-acetylmuramate dehydrogenase [Alicyclobacillus sp. SO9]QQE80705.1 UDP-N-acetylmuramate dehydrogenase [Alicyclobacillus sp. SO9]